MDYRTCKLFFLRQRYLPPAIQRLLAREANLLSDHALLDREAYAEEGATQALEKALMFTIDAYSHSGLVRDDEIIHKLQDTLRHFKRRSISNLRNAEGIEAYVLINCDLGLEDAVIKELLAIPEVAEVKGVFGVYDIIVKIYTDSEDEVKRAIARVRAIEKIKSSLTMMVIESQNGNAPDRQ